METIQIREVQGPCIARPFNEGLSVKKDKRIEEVIANGIVFTISSHLDLTNPQNARRIAELVHLTRHDEIGIDLSPNSKVDAPDEEGQIGRITFDERDGYFSLTTTRNPNSERGIRTPIQHEILQEHYALSPEQAYDLNLEIRAHRKLGNEVFVTDDKQIIDDRYVNGFIKDVGVHSVEEACEKAGVIIRRSGTVPVGKSGYTNISIDAGMTYYRTARLLMPNVGRALSNALSPNNRDVMRGMADFLDTMFGHYVHQLMALDELAVWHWRDQYLGGNNNLLEHQMYHFQYLLMLTSGILETLAWVIAEFDELKPKKRDVGFRIVAEKKRNWVSRLSKSKPIAEFIAGDPRTRELLTTMELRHLVAHREGLPSMIGGVVKILDHDRMIFDEEINYGMVLVDLNEIALPDCQGGTIRQDHYCHIIPYVYARYIVFLLAKYLDDTFSTIEWAEADWLEQTQDCQQYFDLSETQKTMLIDMLGQAPVI